MPVFASEHRLVPLHQLIACFPCPFLGKGGGGGAHPYLVLSLIWRHCIGFQHVSWGPGGSCLWVSIIAGSLRGPPISRPIMSHLLAWAEIVHLRAGVPLIAPLLLLLVRFLDLLQLAPEAHTPTSGVYQSLLRQLRKPLLASAQTSEPKQPTSMQDRSPLSMLFVVSEHTDL